MSGDMCEDLRCGGDVFNDPSFARAQLPEVADLASHEEAMTGAQAPWCRLMPHNPPREVMMQTCSEKGVCTEVRIMLDDTPCYGTDQA